VEFKPGSISVVTDAVKLEGIYLGSFKIHLCLRDMRGGSDAFKIIALDPQPAACNSDITHPHVQSERLCAGDATVPVANALREGRICDAFLAINSVLMTYNPNSPYVSLNSWLGTACEDCGAIIDEGGGYFCDGCDNEFCGDCIRTCECCEESRCRNCLEEDRESGVLCCRACREECRECGRIVDADHFHSDSGLCPGCLQRQREEQAVAVTEPEPQTQSTGDTT
jgi:hypothetical protein